MKTRKVLLVITTIGIVMITVWHVSFVERNGVYMEVNGMNSWWISLPSKPLWSSPSQPLASDFFKAFDSMMIPSGGTISVRTEWSIMATGIA